MTARDELLAAVIAERLDCRWFATPPKIARPVTVADPSDDDVTTARRRRLAVDDEMERGRWVQRHGVQVWEVSA